MSLLVAVVLGVVQGVFMFVPVSSTSHLVLTQTLLRDRGVALPAPDSPEMVLFDLVVHVGTLVSVVVVMGAGLRELGDGVRRREPVAVRLVGLMLLSVAVTGVVGILLQDGLARVFGTPTLIALALLVTGGMLWWTDAMTPSADRGRLRFAWRDESRIGVGTAVAVGLAQAAALTPGLSRSGTTIFAALLLGMPRQLAARYSFFVAIPTILAATGVQTLQVALGEGFGEVGWGAMFTGFAVAAVVGTAALWLVLRLLEQARFRVFSWYVWALAAVVLVSGVGLESHG